MKQILEQKESEKKLASLIKEMYQTAYSNMGEYHELWESLFDAHDGKYFNEKLPSYKSQNISNFVFSTIETIKPIMLANNPEFTVLPSDTLVSEYVTGSQQAPMLTPYEKAVKANACLHYEWQRAKMFLKFHEGLTTALVCGTMIMFLGWDGKNITNTLISPFNFYVDPMATSIDDAQYMMYAEYRSIKDVIEMKPELRTLIMKAAERPQDKYLAFNKETSNADASQNILYVEAYIRDYTMEVVEYEESEGVKVQESKMKYPNGRRVIIAGDVLIEDDENPYPDMPFVIYKCYPVPGKFYGMGEAQQILSPTLYTNKIVNNILESARLNANPVWIVDKNSGVAKNSLSNRDGLVIRKNPGTEVRREAPPALPAYLLNLPTMLTSHIENISGVYDVTRGERPSGITAAAAIQALNEQAQGRIRLKVQHLENTIGELGNMWLRRIRQFWTNERMVKIIGDMGQTKFEVVKPDDLDGDFEVEVFGGSIMSSNHTAKQQLMVSLAQTQGEDGLPMIDRQSLLENMGIPRVKEIVNRINMIKQQQMQMQQQQQEAQAQMAMAQDMEAKMQEMTAAAPPPGQPALQDNQTQLQSNGEDPVAQMDKEALLGIIQELQSMSPEELQAAIEADPRLKDVIEAIAEEGLKTQNPLEQPA